MYHRKVWKAQHSQKFQPESLYFPFDRSSGWIFMAKICFLDFYGKNMSFGCLGQKLIFYFSGSDENKGELIKGIQLMLRGVDRYLAFNFIIIVKYLLIWC